MQKHINTLITDFDNTLFNWLENWYQAFNEALNYITDNIRDINQETLIKDIKTIHETHRTAEYINVFNDIAKLPKYSHYPNIQKLCNYATDLRKSRQKNIHLFDGVIETFESLKENGVTIVIFTESEAYHTLSRIKTLKLDGIVDYVYAPPSKNHEIPSLSKTKFVQLQDSEHQKPNPENLNKIIVELGIDKENCCYLGDNPMKDIQMAKIANVTDIYAKYGDIDRNTKEYQLLKAVTYWKDSLVKTEENINTDKISPSYTLNTSIRELLKIFNIKEELHV